MALRKQLGSIGTSALLFPGKRRSSFKLTVGGKPIDVSRTTVSRIFLTCAALMLALIAGSAFSQKKYGPGVTDTEIKMGQTYPYSGPLSAYSTIAKATVAYLAKINAEGGINGRKLRLISLDDAYNQAKTVEQTRKLVEQDEVLFIFNSLGTPTNTAVHKYLNAKKVPHLFVGSGATKWGDPQNYPWTIGGIQLAYQAEARIYANYILQTRPAAKIAVLYQNDDLGKDYLKGLKDGLADKAASLIVAESTFEPADPTVDSQVVALRRSGADTFVSITSPKAAAQAIRKAADIGWKPLYIQSLISSSVETVLKPAGLSNSIGVISVGFAKDPTDPQWADDVAVVEWRAWMKQYNPEANLAEILNVTGYNYGQTLVQVLKQCGDDLSRENVMRQAANLHDFQLPMFIPGIKINTSATDYYPVEQGRMMRFDGTRWVRFGPILDARVNGK